MYLLRSTKCLINVMPYFALLLVFLGFFSELALAPAVAVMVIGPVFVSLVLGLATVFMVLAYSPPSIHILTVSFICLHAEL